MRAVVQNAPFAEDDLVGLLVLAIRAYGVVGFAASAWSRAITLQFRMSEIMWAGIWQ